MHWSKFQILPLQVRWKSLMKYGLKSQMMRWPGKEMKMVGMMSMSGTPVEAGMLGQKMNGKDLTQVASIACTQMIW